MDTKDMGGQAFRLLSQVLFYVSFMGSYFHTQDQDAYAYQYYRPSSRNASMQHFFFQP